LHTACSVREAMEKLAKKPYDIIVSDYQMPGEDGIQFLKSIRARGDRTPFILFTGKGREEVVIEALNNGADSYLQKGGDPVPQYAELEHRIQALVQRHRAEEALRESEEKYQTILNQAADGIVIHDRTGRIIDVNRKLCTSLGYSREELLSMSIGDIDPDAFRLGPSKLWGIVFKGESYTFETKHLRKDGSAIHVEVTLVSLRLPLGVAIIGMVRDITDRKVIESAVRESESRYQLLAENINDVIWTLDIATQRFTYISPSVEKLRGFTVEEAMQQTMEDSVDPDSYAEIVRQLPLWIEEFRGAGKAGPSRRDIVKQSRKDGTWVRVEVISTLLKNDMGEIVEVLGVSRDVTDRVNAEEALRDVIQRYELVMDGSSAGLWDWDVVNKRTHFSTQWKAMRGFADDEIGESETEWSTRIHPDDIRKVTATLQEHFLGHIPIFEKEYRVRCKDGSYIWILDRGKAVRDAKGKVVRMAGSEINITERKRADEALQGSEKKFRSLFENMLDGLAYCKMLFDAGGQPIDFVYLDVNSAFESLTGLTGAVGKRVTEVIPRIKELTPELFDTYGRVAATGKSEEFEINFKPLSMWLHISVFSPEKGYFVAVFENITERKKAEEALRQANNKLSILNSVTRHDINNQMMVVNGLIDLAKKRENNPELTQMLDKMSHAASNVQEQIVFTKDYLELGIRAPAWASVGRRIADAFATLHPAGMELEDGTDGLEVLTDPMAEKVHYNLVDNSIRHGGKVTRIKISAEQVNDAMLIAYEDDGIGISAEDKQHLFEKGFGKNTGYGLFLIREILAITGITIEEKGHPGKGVRFEMLVPPGAWRWTTQ
jgi:PAS domain S-box-containing protein